MLVLGHRGASADMAENTPEAFRLADEQGADGVELDVRLTPAGSLMVRHDPAPPGTDLRDVPSLTDVLTSCGDRMVVNVEIKNLASDGGFDATMAIVSLTVDELGRLGERHRHRWLISSFSLATIGACRRLAPDLPTALLCVSADEATIERLASGGHRAIHPWHGIVTTEFVERCHGSGLLVHAWTCNDPARLVELRDSGVDGVCTDVPAIALAALGRRLTPGEAGPVSWGTPT